jgi:pimeloyl-ACP methyl ester carboxylesterase
VPGGVSRLAAGEVDIAYETLGKPADPAVLLIQGLGGQLVDWPDGFCAQLVERGLYVVRFDNRDVGLSSHSGVPPPDLRAVLSGDGRTSHSRAQSHLDLVDHRQP